MLQKMDKEQERLEKLYSFNILDSDPENEYNRVTYLAVRRFNVPIAYISLIDKNRQWFKSKQGLDMNQTPLEASLCKEAIKGGESCIVYDALADDVFRKIATHPTYIHPLRFYAAAPIKTSDNHVIGSLSIADYKANHSFSDNDKNDLENMAHIIINLIENQQD